jgi:hypothetical protein
MAILSGFERQKDYITDQDKNHKLISKWTHSDTVMFSDEESLTTKNTSIQNRLGQLEDAILQLDTHKLDNTGIQTYNGALIFDDTTGSVIITALETNNHLKISGKTIQGYTNGLYEGETLINPDGGRVMINGKRATIFETVPSYKYDDQGNLPNQFDEYGNPTGVIDEEFIPKVLVSSEYQGQIKSSGRILAKDVLSDAKLTDESLRQTASNMDGNFRVLLSATADDASRTEGAKKSTALRFNPSTKVLYVGGNVELSSATPFIDFHLASSTHDYTARIIQRETNKIDFVGDSTQTGTWATLQAAAFSVQSSIHVKDNISSITDEDAKRVLELNPVKFDYKFGDKNQRGLIAEEVLGIMPEMVTIPDGYKDFDPDKPWRTPSIDYSKFVPYLIKMIQIQQTEIDALKERLNWRDMTDVYGNYQ